MKGNARQRVLVWQLSLHQVIRVVVSCHQGTRILLHLRDGRNWPDGCLCYDQVRRHSLSVKSIFPQQSSITRHQGIRILFYFHLCPNHYWLNCRRLSVESFLKFKVNNTFDKAAFQGRRRSGHCSIYEIVFTDQEIAPVIFK